ncbi:MAG: beta-lactamase family protein, partial [Rhodospirillales bacterium]|nr:beta-lactamase family protein [Rhodospirillales bacterium]
MSTPLPTAQPEDVGLSAAALERLTHVLRQRAADGHVPGGVAIVARHGKVAYHQAFGVQDPASGQPMPQDAIFRIYSMTKAIVSVAVMML